MLEDVVWTVPVAKVLDGPPYAWMMQVCSAATLEPLVAGALLFESQIGL